MSGGTGPALSNIFQTDQGLNILTTEPAYERILNISSSRGVKGNILNTPTEQMKVSLT